MVVCLSARSALDLYLQAKAFKHGSHVLISAINIPDIADILEYHHLIPIPVDIDITTLGMKLSDASRLVTPNTKIIFATHIFGTRNNMENVIQFAAVHNLTVIEDCAQCFSGLDYTGHPMCDISLFSFGMIKTNTALGGGIATVKSKAVEQKMNEIQSNYPVQSCRSYFFKIMIALLACFIQLPIVTRNVIYCSKIFRFNYKPIFNYLIRGFSPNERNISKFRYQPSPWLLRVLSYRLLCWDKESYDKQMRRMNVFADKLTSANVFIPGLSASKRDFWLFPVGAIKGSTSQETMQRFEEMGFAAAVSYSRLTWIKPPEGNEAEIPHIAKEFLERAVYLPVHRSISVTQMVQLVDCCRALYEQPSTKAGIDSTYKCGTVLRKLTTSINSHVKEFVNH